MADKSIDQLNAAEKVYATDLFVLQQSGTAKKLTGQVLENWLVSFADGHGGIQSIQKLSTSGLVDTYRITLADTTTFDFVVTNGRGISGIAKTSTNGLVDTYTITYNDGTTSTFTVKNGEKGDKGDNTYTWIKYASQEPTESSHSMGDIPDDWRGEYNGPLAVAPTDWKQYKWYKVKGDKGNTGEPAVLANKSVTYQVSDSGTIIPSGAWVSSVPVVPQGKYLWTKTEIQFNTGDPIVSYSVARMGMDGSGSVSTVNNVSPDETGNVPLTADNVGALPATGGDMTGELRMNGQPISGLNAPTENTQAANKGYVDGVVRKAAPVNLLYNSDFTRLVAPYGYLAGKGGGTYLAEKWPITGRAPSYNPDTREITFNSEGLSIINQAVEWDIAGKTVTLAINARSVNGAVSLTEHNVQSGHANVPINTGITVHTFVGGDDTLVRVFSSSGGKIVIDWIALYEGTYTAETLPEYRPKGYMVESLNCGALHVTTTATLSTSWSGSGPYTQAVTVAGILSTDTPHIMPVYSTTNSTAIAQKEAWACVSKAVTEAGKITFTCFEDKPATAIPIQIEVNR